MATIDLTLNGIKIPAISGYTPPFGTKKATGGLTTQEVNDNVIAPFVKQRPIVVTEDSTTGTIEYDAALSIEENGVTLGLGAPAYAGCRVTVHANTSVGYVSFKDISNSDATIGLTRYKKIELIAIDSNSWAPADGTTFLINETIASRGANVNNWDHFWYPGTYHYIYETSTAAATYGLPSNFVSVTVISLSNTRATALAQKWQGTTVSYIWTNNLQETWGTWALINPAEILHVQQLTHTTASLAAGTDHNLDVTQTITNAGIDIAKVKALEVTAGIPVTSWNTIAINRAYTLTTTSATIGIRTIPWSSSVAQVYSIRFNVLYTV